MPTQPAPLTPAQKNEDNSFTLQVVTIVFTILQQFVVCLRILARKMSRQDLWWDDWLVIFAAVLSWVQFALLQKAIEYGLGRHVQTVPQPNLRPFLIIIFCTEIWIGATLTLVKCSTLCLYIRLFRIKQKFTKICYGMIAFVLAWFASVIFSIIFQCSPIEAAWIKTPEMLSTAKCVRYKYWLVGSNVPNILSNLVIIFMPMPLIWGLKLSKPRKAGLCFVFYLAISATSTSTVRLIKSFDIEFNDITWGSVDVTLLSTAEGNVGIITACLPILAPVIRMATCTWRKDSTRRTPEYVEDANDGNARTDRSHQPPHSTVSGRNSRSLRAGNFNRRDNTSNGDIMWSDRSISSPSHGRSGSNTFPMGAIRKTTTITVSYDQRQDDSETKTPQLQSAEQAK